MNDLSAPVITPAPSATTVTARLFHRQRALFCMLIGFAISSLLLVVIVWLAGLSQFVLLLAAMQFFLLPFAVLFSWKSYVIKTVLLSFTTQGLSLEASDQQYQIAWENLAGYKVEFNLDQLIGAGYRLTLRDTQGHSTVFNLLEQQLVDSAGGFRGDSALSHMCRYIGWYNKKAEGSMGQVVLLPTIFDRKIGTLLLGAIGILLLVDLGMRALHPARTVETLGTLAMALMLGLHAWGQKRNNDRYINYLHKLEAEGSDSYAVGP